MRLSPGLWPRWWCRDSCPACSRGSGLPFAHFESRFPLAGWSRPKKTNRSPPDRCGWSGLPLCDPRAVVENSQFSPRIARAEGWPEVVTRDRKRCRETGSWGCRRRSSGTGGEVASARGRRLPRDGIRQACGAVRPEVTTGGTRWGPLTRGAGVQPSEFKNSASARRVER